MLKLEVKKKILPSQNVPINQTFLLDIVISFNFESVINDVKL